MGAPDERSVASSQGPYPGGRAETTRSRPASESGEPRSRSADMPREQRREAKLLVQQFTTEMVKGRYFEVVLPSGQTRSRFCMLTRKLDAFRIKTDKETSDARNIPLTTIEEIIAGADTARTLASRGLETPLSELSVTLALTDQTFITFLLQDVEARDTFAMCITMFANRAKTERLHPDSVRGHSRGRRDDVGSNAGSTA